MPEAYVLYVNVHVQYNTYVVLSLLTIAPTVSRDGGRMTHPKLISTFGRQGRILHTLFGCHKFIHTTTQPHNHTPVRIDYVLSRHRWIIIINQGPRLNGTMIGIEDHGKGHQIFAKGRLFIPVHVCLFGYPRARAHGQFLCMFFFSHAVVPLGC